MPPTSTRIISLPLMLAVVILAAGGLVSKALARAQEGGSEKKAEKPVYVDYKGVRIGMETTEVRKKLGAPLFSPT